MRRRAWPIRWWLASFGAAVALPFIVLIGVMFAFQVRSERREAQSTALSIAHVAADRLAGVRTDAVTFLRLMATRPAVQHFDSEPCDSLFPVVDLFPQYVNLLLVDSDGRLRCAANPSEARDRAITAAAISWIQSGMRGKTLQMEKLTMQQFGADWVSTVTVPVRSATLTLVILPDVVEREVLPRDAVVTVIDRSGVVLARSSDPQHWIGRNVRGSGVTEVVLGRGEGTAESVGIDRVSRQYGFTFIPELGWYVYAGIPSVPLMRPVRDLYIRGLVVGLIVIVLAIALAGVVAPFIERPVNELVAQLKALPERLIKVQEEERTRVSREIHDDLGQSLSALKMDIIGVLEKNPAAPPTRERIERTLDNTVDAVRRIAAELRPAMLDDLGLTAALEAEVRVFEERTGIECELSLPEKPLPLTPISSTVLYRIVQESLTNVLRHSNASRVEIRLRERGDDALLEVRDDGRGMTAEEAAAATSIGLIGIRERASMLGGTAEFEGVAGRGTIVSVRIPIAS
ncbi:MAG TPA: ATP-binding protein [Thermoanaerobaculia bacterium]|nr:ATP-binding protein [Thermoanaerobaculia bacterium]